MPKQKGMRLNDELWEKFGEVCARQGRHRASVTNALILHYLSLGPVEQQRLMDRLARWIAERATK